MNVTLVPNTPPMPLATYYARHIANLCPHPVTVETEIGPVTFEPVRPEGLRADMKADQAPFGIHGFAIFHEPSLVGLSKAPSDFGLSPLRRDEETGEVVGIGTIIVADWAAAALIQEDANSPWREYLVMSPNTQPSSATRNEAGQIVSVKGCHLWTFNYSTDEEVGLGGVSGRSRPRKT